MSDLLSRVNLPATACVVLSLGIGVASAVAADPGNVKDAADALDEIVVTAQKRSESVQDVPLSISAIGGQALADRQIVDLASLSEAIPNISFGQEFGQARIAIRGLGINSVNPGNEGRVAFHVDGVYISRPGAILGTFFDVDRIEVLRGPQGTLYGRNAVAGTINLVTRDPTSTYTGYSEATIGNYDRVTLEGGLGGPITDTVSFRLAGQTNDRSGWGKNVVDGDDIDNQRTRAVRGKLRFEPDTNLNVTLSADFQTENDNSNAYHFGGQVIPGTPVLGEVYGGYLPPNPARNLASDAPITFFTRIYGFDATANWNLAPSYTLTSVSGYRGSDIHQRSDIDLTSARLGPYDTLEQAHQLSEELRLSHTYSRGDWLIGGYFFDEDITTRLLDPQDQQLLLGPGVPYRFVDGYAAGGSLSTHSFAGFGQTDFNINDQLSITAGGRYSSDRRNVNEFLQFDLTRPYNPTDPIEPIATQIGSVTYNSFTPKASIQYKPFANFMAYVSFSEGFKSGGYNLGAVGKPYSPEKLKAYETGIKSDFLQRKARLNVSLFYYDFTNLQVNKTLEQNEVIENAASATLYGAEAELTLLPVERVKIDLNAAWTHSRYDKYCTEDAARPAGPPPGTALCDPADPAAFNLAGNRLEQAPEFSGTLGIEYSVPTTPGVFTLRGEVFSTSRIFFTQYNLRSNSQAAYSLVDAYLNFEQANDHFYGSVFVKNLFDRTVFGIADAGSAIVDSPVQATFLPPRTYGVRFGYRF
jgi:iron complex outermembrane receptor protein